MAVLWRSRKFRAALLGIALVILKDVFKLPMFAVKIITTLLGLYIGGQAIEDAARSWKATKFLDNEKKK